MANMMPTQQRYDAVTIAFHWLTAALVLALFGTAMVWTNAPREMGLRWLSGIHVSLGVGLAIVVLGRLIWRLTAGRRLGHGENGITRLAARFVHLALYLLLLGQIGLGFAIEWISGNSISVFGLFDIPTPFVENRDLAHQFENIHGVVALDNHGSGRQPRSRCLVPSLRDQRRCAAADVADTEWSAR